MTAWLMLAKETSKRASEGYDDHPSTHYSWDSTVPNHGKVQAGDVIILWDSKKLLGLSVIENITQGEAEKKTPLCPACRRADVATRKTLQPRFRCDKTNCKSTFEEPHWTLKKVKTYRSQHDKGWIPANDFLSGTELRNLCPSPHSQLSLRKINWNKFKAALDDSQELISLNIIESTKESISGGHAITTIRARRGQGSFRKNLLRQFGEKCAFTGPAPSQALEAAHLYSYAADGTHHEGGGLLLRSDLHKLFDLGLIAVNPKSKKLDLTEELMKYPDYRKLHGSWLSVDVTSKHMKWITRHWKIHRGPE